MRPVDNITGSLAPVNRQDVIHRSTEHLRKAGPDCRRRVAEAVDVRRRNS